METLVGGAMMKGKFVRTLPIMHPKAQVVQVDTMEEVRSYPALES